MTAARLANLFLLPPLHPRGLLNPVFYFSCKGQCSLLHLMLAMEWVKQCIGSSPHKLRRWGQMAVTLSGPGQIALLELSIHFFPLLAFSPLWLCICSFLSIC